MCARSSVEAEYRAMVMGVTELLWLKILLKDLRMFVDEPIHLYYDNKAAINFANNPIDHHFIRKKIDFEELILPYIKSEEQLTNIFTKGISCAVFKKNVTKLNMFDMYAQLEKKC